MDLRKASRLTIGPVAYEQNDGVVMVGAYRIEENGIPLAVAPPVAPNDWTLVDAETGIALLRTETLSELAEAIDTRMNEILQQREFVLSGDVAREKRAQVRQMMSDHYDVYLHHPEDMGAMIPCPFEGKAGSVLAPIYARTEYGDAMNYFLRQGVEVPDELLGTYPEGYKPRFDGPLRVTGAFVVSIGKSQVAVHEVMDMPGEDLPQWAAFGIETGIPIAACASRETVLWCLPCRGLEVDVIAKTDSGKHSPNVEAYREKVRMAFSGGIRQTAGDYLRTGTLRLNGREMLTMLKTLVAQERAHMQEMFATATNAENPAVGEQDDLSKAVDE